MRPDEENVDIQREIAEYDADGIILQLLRLVSIVDDTPITDLPPVTDVIDPDALERMLSMSESPLEVVFNYAGYVVAFEYEPGHPVVIRITD